MKSVYPRLTWSMAILAGLRFQGLTPQANISPLDQVPLLPPPHQPTPSGATASSAFYPLLPPAIPLAVRSPYLSAWLATGAEGGNGGYLSGRWAQFWPVQYPSNNPSQFQLAWSGLIRINGTTYQFMGQPKQDLINPQSSPQEILEPIQLSMVYTSTQTTFEFQAGPVRFKVNFLSPIGNPGDLLRQSLPFSYLTIQIINPDQELLDHQIEVYTDIQADWASGDHQVNSTWELQQTDQILSYHVQRKDPLLFSEQWEYAEWGQAIYATNKVKGLTTASGASREVRSQFVTSGNLNGQQDVQFRKINDRTPTFAYSVPITSGSDPIVFTIGHIRDPYVSYVKSNSTSLQPRFGYWRSEFDQSIQAIDFFLHDYHPALKDSIKLDQIIADDAKRLGGEDYVSIVSLSARQAMGGIEITVGKDSQGNFNRSDVSIFLKEISSNGDMSTVDVIFPQFPILAYLDPVLLKLILDPIFEYSESGLYPNKWTVHDLGRYPNATGHDDGRDEPMPVEEAGNMLIMALAYHQLSKDSAWLSRHYKILSQWTLFLIQDGLIPASQLSTDDFAGKLANQTNLALKAIVGIGAMSEIAHVIGDQNNGKELRSIAERYVKDWIGYSLSQDRSHTKLAYQDDKSWGTLYNLFADRLLNLKLIPEFIYELQTSFYPTIANEYGVPLDSRHTWAKTDWEMFAAGTMKTVTGRDLFIGKVSKYLKANRVDAGFPDLYETETAEFPGRSNTSTWRIEFINRPVVGGHFSILALDKLNQINGIKGYPFRKGQISAAASRVGGLNLFGLVCKILKQPVHHLFVF